MMRKVLDEPLVEVSEAKERLYFFPVGRNGPVGYSGNFDGVHFDGIVGDNDSKIFHSFLFEFTLVRF